MRRFRLWLARKLVGPQPFMANMTIRCGTVTVPITPGNEATILNSTFTHGANLTATNTATVAPSVFYATSRGPILSFDGTNLMEDEMGKKKKRSKAAGKAAAKNKQENKQKATGGKKAR